ncbi:uncharacterized protein EURHEDRAFT_405568 [Aspergillus ruber CBS 135680]|uniref:Uncharacterized protein n=1 Tax=Aspergillus ruber (strain CBS 135680) TaxID=1388766 RepID=A0A017S4W4_ASPRC|nr:uncharacterized protein EURHEDRAFT_405568 [Aspergillus ruber CBS 135680]EYE91896.1 hypothetical protein EURHEDRAFT_405568 [Aspergillus ruber CBS 135680]
MKLFPLSISVTMVTAIALPVVKILVDEAALPDSIPRVFHENERMNRTCTRHIDCGAGVCRDGHCYYDNRFGCFPDRICDIGTCYHGYCYVDEDHIPWDDGGMPNNFDNDNDNGDVAKKDFWSTGNDDKTFREMIDDIHQRAKARPSMAKREAQCEGIDIDCQPGQFCNRGICFFPNLPDMAERSEQGLCSIPGECAPYDYGPDDLEKSNINKDVNCHNDEQCSPGVCQDGICLLK